MASSILLMFFPPNPEITGLAEIPTVDFKSFYCVLDQHNIKISVPLSVFETGISKQRSVNMIDFAYW